MTNTTLHVKPLSELPRTEEECPKCEDGRFVIDDHHKFCENCHYAPTRDANKITRVDEWREFWTRRQADYSGFRGPDRIKAVGGFSGAYVDWNPE